MRVFKCDANDLLMPIKGVPYDAQLEVQKEEDYAA